MTRTVYWGMLAGGLALWAIAALLPRYRLARTNAFVLSTLLVVTAVMRLAGGCGSLVFYVLSVIPAALIAQHAVYLAHMKNPFSNQGRGLTKIDDKFLPNNFQNGLAQAQRMSELYFGLSSLSFRFGLPAVLILFLVGIFGDELYRSPPAWIVSDFIRGAQYGGAGGYVYVLLYLTRRNFRHDITSGAAVWSVVNLVLGVLLGGVVALLWKTQGNPQGFSSAVIYFGAGLAPRHMASVLEEAAKRLVRSPDDKIQAPGARIKPLTALRGITAPIAERLEEEGIEDVYGMAMTDPTRLMRNTSFDQRQIVAWIDEAILVSTLPNSWEALEALGITGAIDLAWYGDCDEVDSNSAERSAATEMVKGGGGGGSPDGAKLRSTSAASGTVPLELKSLADAAKINPDTLWDTVQRFYWDGQVQLIWVLYQIGAEGVQNDVPTPDSPKEPR
jgi:hypothetical protein